MSPTRLSRLERSMRIALAHTDAFNSRDLPAMAELTAEICVLESAHPPPVGAQYPGRDRVAEYWQQFLGRLPDTKLEIEEVFGLGERCILRWRARSPGVAEEQCLRGVHIYRIGSGAIQQILVYVKGDPFRAEQGPA